MTNICDRLTKEDAAILQRLPLARKLILRSMQQHGDAPGYSLMRIHEGVRAGGWPIDSRNELRVKMSLLKINMQRPLFP